MSTNRDKSNEHLETAEKLLHAGVFAKAHVHATLSVVYAIHAMADDLEGQDREELAALMEEQEDDDKGRTQ